MFFPTSPLSVQVLLFVSPQNLFDFFFPRVHVFWRNKEHDREKGQSEKIVRVKLGAPKSFLIIVL